VRPALVAILAIACMAIGLFGNALAGGRKLVVGIVDQVTWSDLLSDEVQAPTLKGLARNSGAGLMCVRTGRASGGGYLTIGAGARASASQPQSQPGLEGRAFLRNEIVGGEAAGRAYAAYTGWPVGANGIVHLGIGDLVRQNQPTTYPITLGLLGSALHRSGLHVACVGNADLPDSPHRELAAVAMDERGRVEFGDIGAGLLERDPRLPYLLTTRGDRLLSAFRRALAVADLIVVDFGETSRVGEYADAMPPAAAQAARRRAVERVDSLLAGVLRELPPTGWGLMLLAPTARAADPEEQFANLTPVIFYLPGAERGLLTSPSTRRPGLVLNTDVAPTILGYFSLQTPPAAVGRPMRVEPTRGDLLARVKSDEARQAGVEVARRYAFRWLAVLAAIALWAAAGMFALGEGAPRWVRVLLRGLLLVLLAAPPALLLVGLRPMSAAQMLAGAVAISLVIAFLGAAATRWRAGHVPPALLLVALLVYDLVKGQTMLQWSPLSYSAAAGARFYGLGNEYGGALLGAALVSAASMLPARERGGAVGRLLAGVVLLGIAGLVGYPRFGANLGMALACAIGFAAFIVYLWSERPTWADAVAALLVALLVAGAAMAVDVFRHGAEASHLGLFAASLRSQGWGALGQVAIRKWTLNWLLVRTSLWTDAALAGFGVVGVLLLARPRRAVAAMAERPWLAPALTACVVGAIASWALNDSGIVAAALVLLYGAGSFAYLGLGEA